MTKQELMDKKMKLLIICPTRKRPKLLEKMLCSYNLMTDFSIDTTLVLLTDNDDNSINRKEIMKKHNCLISNRPRTTITKYINYIFETVNNEYDYFMVINDDMIFKTSAWNRVMLEIASKGMIAYPDDGNSKGVIPAAFMIPTFIAKAVGYLQMPTLIHLYGDIVWQTIMNKCNINGYCKDVLLEHNHPMFKKRDEDEVYKYTNSREMYSLDQASFREWLKEKSYDECQKVKLALQSMPKKI